MPRALRGFRGRAVLLIGATIPWIMAQGCPPPKQPPVANAGPDQTVAFGTLVTLDGTGSYDPDGDRLSFSWTQLSGTRVVLSGATTAAPTFTAPGADTILVFQLRVSDGLGGSDTDSVQVTVQSSTKPPPQLFVANRTGNSVTSYQNPGALNGNVAPDTIVIGGQTQLGNPSDMVVTTGGSLLVSNFASSSLTIYPNAISVTGNVAPSGIVRGDATLLESVTSLEVNTAKDLLFVSEIGFINRVVVFANVSGSGFSGDVPATRTISSGNMVNPLGIHLAANDDLYVANNGPANVIVFAGASTLNGFVLPNRTVTSSTFGAVFDVDVDASDRLYVLSGAIGNNQISIFKNASKLNGFLVPDGVLIVSGATSLAAMEVDSNGVGYVLDAGAAAIYVYDAIGTRNGALPPDRTIQGQNTQLVGAVRLFLLEP